MHHLITIYAQISAVWQCHHYYIVGEKEISPLKLQWNVYFHLGIYIIYYLFEDN